jgi:hypothetical protein
VIVGSYVPEGVVIGDWVRQTAQGLVAFYDIDTPVTLAELRRSGYEYLAPRQIAYYDLYLSFAGGPVLELIEGSYGCRPRAPCIVRWMHNFTTRKTSLCIGIWATWELIALTASRH